MEFSTYKSVVRKVAKLFKALEEQSGFLSNEVTRSGVYALIEQVMEDLNNYSECMIPISGSWGSSAGLRRLTREEGGRREQYNQYQAISDLRPAAASKALLRPVMHSPARGPHGR